MGITLIYLHASEIMLMKYSYTQLERRFDKIVAGIERAKKIDENKVSELVGSLKGLRKDLARLEASIRKDESSVSNESGVLTQIKNLGGKIAQALVNNRTYDLGHSKLVRTSVLLNYSIYSAAHNRTTSPVVTRSHSTASTSTPAAARCLFKP